MQLELKEGVHVLLIRRLQASVSVRVTVCNTVCMDEIAQTEGQIPFAHVVLIAGLAIEDRICNLHPLRMRETVEAHGYEGTQ